MKTFNIETEEFEPTITIDLDPESDSFSISYAGKKLKMPIRKAFSLYKIAQHTVKFLESEGKLVDGFGIPIKDITSRDQIKYEK